MSLKGRPRGVGGWAWCVWNYVRDVLIVFWVARVSLFTLILGFLLLDWTSQGQDLFVSLATQGWWQNLKFQVLLFVVWAMPTHYAARLLLDTDKRLRLRAALRPGVEPIVCWVPRLLGFATFAVVLLSIGRSCWNLPLIDDPGYIDGVGRALAWCALYTLIGGFLFYLYVQYRNVAWVESLLLGIVRAARAAARWIRDALLSLFKIRFPKRVTPPRTLGDSRYVGKFLLVLVFLAFLGILWLGGQRAAVYFPRMQAIPFVLGGWLPLLAFLSHYGRRLRAPLILATIITVMLITALVGNNHSVRRINALQTAGPAAVTTRMSLRTAVDLWMAANKCTGHPEACPRPIVVAAAGGASHAGYFMASIVGYLLQEARQHDLDENQIRNRLFAISSVSGGSVGAVMVATALAAAPDTAQHPCPSTPFVLWYGERINNWRDCLEALMVGDFLTPTFIGLMFDDMFPFGAWRDRAALLEESWETRYASLIKKRTGQGNCDGLKCPFLTLRPTAAHWIPLLLLNGSSAGSGRRIVTTILDPIYSPTRACPTGHRADTPPNLCLLLTETYFFHDLLADATEPKGILTRFQRYLLSDYRKKRVLDDVRLSTAAHNSARFPLISPPGSVRNGKHQIIDRIVDGGYFENYGALTAMELIEGIRAVEPGLAPFAMVVSNDPKLAFDHEDDTNPPTIAPVRPIDVDDTELLTDLSSPLRAFLNTWDGRGTLAVAQMRALLYQRLRDCGASVAHVRVWPQVTGGTDNSRPVSMSWWLSEPLQIHLHQQTEPMKNQNDNGPGLARVWAALGANSSCATPQKPSGPS
jgi:hypothetical protein